MSQFFVFLLLLDSAWVVIGLANHQNMWAWIVLYWMLLTLKNGHDFFKGGKRK